METILIYYSSNGTTEYAAEKLARALSVPKENVRNVSKVKDLNLKPYKNIILGCSTWNANELPYDIEQFLIQIKTQNLTGKSIAIFGAGNQHRYPHSFVNAIGQIYQRIKDTNCNWIGKVSTLDYSFTDSIAQQGDNFLGLPIDDETQSELTLERIKKWAEQLKKEFVMQDQLDG